MDERWQKVDILSCKRSLWTTPKCSIEPDQWGYLGPPRTLKILLAIAVGDHSIPSLFDNSIIKHDSTLCRKVPIFTAACSLKTGWRLLVDTFFQNGQILVDSFRGWILVDTFGEFFLSTRIPLLGWIFVDIFLVNSSGHFLMVITKSANTVGQPMQGVQGRSPC